MRTTLKMIYLRYKPKFAPFKTNTATVGSNLCALFIYSRIATGSVTIPANFITATMACTAP
jgi:hypothetical protein